MVDVEQVLVRLIRPGDEIPLLHDEIVGDDLHLLEPHRRGRSGDEPRPGHCGLVHVLHFDGAQGVLQLRLVDVHVASDRHQHGVFARAAPVVAVGDRVEHRLARLRLRHAQVLGQRLDRRQARRVDLLQRLRFLVGVSGLLHERRHLGVRRVATLRAEQAVILADLRQVEKLVRVVAAHRARIGQRRDHRHPAALEDAPVGAEHRVVGDVETGLIEVEGVGVLHRELAQPLEAGARTRLVAELGLNLVEV